MVTIPSESRSGAGSDSFSLLANVHTGTLLIFTQGFSKDHKQIPDREGRGEQAGIRSATCLHVGAGTCPHRGFAHYDPNEVIAGDRAESGEQRMEK